MSKALRSSSPSLSLTLHISELGSCQTKLPPQLHPGPCAHCLLPGLLQRLPHWLLCSSLPSTPQPESPSQMVIGPHHASARKPPTLAPISLRVKMKNLPLALPDLGPCQSCHTSRLTLFQPCWPLCCSSNTPSCLECFSGFKSLLSCPGGFTSEASPPP